MFKEKFMPPMEEEKPKEEEAKKEEETKETEERKLGPEEIEGLGEDMGQYVEGLRGRIEEIKEELKIRADDERARELRNELEELEEQYDGLKDFVDAIEAEDYEEITKKSVKE